MHWWDSMARTPGACCKDAVQQQLLTHNRSQSCGLCSRCDSGLDALYAAGIACDGEYLAAQEGQGEAPPVMSRAEVIAAACWRRRWAAAMTCSWSASEHTEMRRAVPRACLAWCRAASCAARPWQAAAAAESALAACALSRWSNSCSHLHAECTCRAVIAP